MKPLLFVALNDLSNHQKQTVKIVNKLLDTDMAEDDFGFKINLDFMLRIGITNALYSIKKFGRPVFADLKMWNGKRTMTDIVKELVDLEVEYLNVYALADTEIPEVVSITNKTNTKVLGLTVLSHYDNDYCKRHFKRSLYGTVEHLANVAVKAGCHGIILPGTVLESVRDLQTIKLVPGIRPVWYKDKRHKEEVTPSFAIERGADILVCGSPIMKADKPCDMLTKILAEIEVAYLATR